MSHPLTETLWDAVVIGTGIGGGTLGRPLAEAGQKVLFVERGPAGPRSARNGLSEVFIPEARLARGLWPEPLHATVDRSGKRLLRAARGRAGGQFGVLRGHAGTARAA